MTIAVRRKPLLFVADIAFWLDDGRGGRLHRLGNRLLDTCLVVT